MSLSKTDCPETGTMAPVVELREMNVCAWICEMSVKRGETHIQYVIRHFPRESPQTFQLTEGNPS